jgi:hypothetical protein
MNPKNLGVNFLRKWEFECKFDREPKEWSLDELYDLYLRAKERADKRNLDFTNHIKNIIESVEPNNGYHEVYFNVNGWVMKYQISKPDYSDWAYSTNRVEFSKDVVKGREEKIDFILGKEIQFELGVEMKRLEKMRSNFHRHIFCIISDVIDEKLNKKYKGVRNFDIPKVLKVDIGGVIHYVALDKQSRDHSYNWKRFEIIGKEDNEIIKL